MFVFLVTYNRNIGETYRTVEIAAFNINEAESRAYEQLGYVRIVCVEGPIRKI